MSDKNPSLANMPAPPVELPSFVTQQKPAEAASKFNPAIPAEKNITSPEPEKKKVDAENTEKDELPSMQDIASALSPITEGVKNSVLFGWMKDTVKSSVQQAKSGIDLVVSTLDPQMSGLIYSGGSTEIIVASSNDDKVEAIREAFQDVFGRATVYGSASQAKTCAIQPIGFENAELKAKERINNLRSKENFADKIIVAVENLLVEVYKNQWFDVGLVMLSDPRHTQQFPLKAFTQMTPIPIEVINKMQTDTPKDYEFQSTGFSTTTASAMSQFLDTPHYEWHKTLTSIDRIDMIVNAAKALASIYKSQLPPTTNLKANDAK